MITIILEGDEPRIIAHLEGHILAFFDDSAPIQEPAEYVRLILDGHDHRILTDESIRIGSVQKAGVLYRSGTYITAETPYNALWRALKELLPPRLYEMLKTDFRLKNAAYSKAKYDAAKDVKQHRMEF